MTKKREVVIVMLELLCSLLATEITSKSGMMLSGDEKQRCYKETSKLMVHVRLFKVLTLVILKCPIFWDIATHNPLQVSRRFGGKLCLLLFHAGLLTGFSSVV
jgi:hypothetical protein